MLNKTTPIFAVSMLGMSYLSAHEGDTQLDETVIVGKAESDLIGYANASSSGQANNEELSQRPVLRRGELLEVVPGMIVTQHSGGGKANQYFLRGYNLDHGTDFHVGVDGMPANYRTHAHGQGYADINFIVPEFIERLDYFKGPFNVEYGDLSTAGGADYRLFHALPGGIFSTTYGSYDYFRLLLGDSWQLGEGMLSLGVEYTHEDGPWDQGNNYNRYNLFARYHVGDDENYWNVTAMGHEGSWDSSDQVPLDLIDNGTLGRYSTIDPSTGGETSRYSLSTQWQETKGNTVTHLDAWVGTYDLELYSNFTYFLNDPVRGDQFEQNGSRVFGGLNLWRSYEYDLAGYNSTTKVGVQTRNDWIDDIGLYHTQERDRLDTVREDDVYVGSYSFFVDHETRFNPEWRAGGGLRGDLFHFDVDSDIDANSGDETDGILSPKLYVAYAPVDHTEFYLNGGLGFHSNDARGVTLTVDPTGEDPNPESADPLVRTKGAEIGVRTTAIKDVTATATLWYIESDSELVYVGDAGTSEAGEPSERWGVELATYWRPREWFTADVEYAWSHARFVDVDSGMDHIPNAIEHTLSAGLTLGHGEGWFGSLRARYFSPYPLEESGQVEADSSFLVNGRVGYRKEQWEVSVDVLNIFDSEDNDIEYYYESRLANELVSVGNSPRRHGQPTEPRQARVNVTYRF
jgi:hypothetical protein